jgi:glutaredoxin 3
LTNKSITVYSTPSCPYCHQAKNYIAQKGFAYTDLDVATDVAARDEMVEKSGQLGVPVIVIDGSIVVGFNRAKLDELLTG